MWMAKSNVTHPGVLLAQAQVNLDNVDHDCRITIAFLIAQGMPWEPIQP